MSWIPSDNFGTRLRVVRHEKRLSTRDVAEICGVNHNSVAHWERGSSPKNMAEIVLKICEATGVDRDWLMFGTEAFENDPFTQSFSRDAGISEPIQYSIKELLFA
jgi:transcriptional regulator with XRE-family HTH domain